jgi:Aldo/keto reductase family/Transketolase, pyrimidine binding domain
MKAMRDWFGDALVGIGERHDNVVVVNCDLGSATKTLQFRKRFPDRFFECGIAEANAIGVAAGLAQEGLRPFVASFGHFLTGKYLEIFQSFGLNDAGVVLVGSHAGLAIGKDGPTRWACVTWRSCRRCRTSTSCTRPTASRRGRCWSSSPPTTDRATCGCAASPSARCTSSTTASGSATGRRSTRASTSSTPPTSTPTAAARRSSARCCGSTAGATKLVVATKVFGPMHDGPNGGGLSRKAIRTAVDRSLRRLGTDHIDLYQIHRFDPHAPVEETLTTLHDLVVAGKVRYLGASSMYAWQFAKLQHTAQAGGLTPFVAMQNHYNLLNREEEREMLPLCRDAAAGVLPWSPLARGRLARDPSATTTTAAALERAYVPHGVAGFS